MFDEMNRRSLKRFKYDQRGLNNAYIPTRSKHRKRAKRGDVLNPTASDRFCWNLKSMHGSRSGQRMTLADQYAEGRQEEERRERSVWQYAGRVTKRSIDKAVWCCSLEHSRAGHAARVTWNVQQSVFKCARFDRASSSAYLREAVQMQTLSSRAFTQQGALMTYPWASALSKNLINVSAAFARNRLRALNI